MNRSFFLVAAVAALALLGHPAGASERPNVVIMLADDMGFGELQCLNPTRGKIPTPNLDAIAESGMVFTDAHSGSSVCTPTRYGLMTGRYAWRTRLQSGVLTGGESLIAEDRLTLAKLLSEQGYDTAVIGKWHLGMLFDGEHIAKAVDVGGRVTHGPLDRGGFDEFHGFHHARQIRTWIDNDQVTEQIEPIEMLPRLTEQAVEYIQSRKDSQQPFFLYVPWSSPHSPVVPTSQWQGKSGLNAHADFVMQTDESFGQVVAALRDAGQLDNTLIICSSDNGTSGPTSKINQLQQMGHYPSGPLRGSKADIWDGGHRVPFLVSWPGVVAPGTRCDDLICLTDVIRTVADILAVDLPDDAAEDSVSFLPSLTGQQTDGRKHVVHHSVSGYFAIRDGEWKLSLCPASGGWTGKRPSKKSWAEYRKQGKPMVQLINLDEDLGEQQNLAERFPDKVQQLHQELERQVQRGRSTPGPDQPNDIKNIVIDKQP
ncbi:arylsulfatase [Roseiconus nitratireducens]|uniref:Arylsulfatase n=1 Tax=Roseiconus nitratireducens TaxID=2605748 RepID=A0A5M6DCE0_9BACT|nr:arylsulfatase [Roseiconus nitratireducens]KAA5545227.1 arylsulfatase [Roseiconus nitratireducens]